MGEAPGKQHADHGAGEKIQARGLGRVDQGEHTQTQAAPHDRPDRLGGGDCHEREGGVNARRGAVYVDVVAKAAKRDGRGGHGIADDHAANGDEIAGRGREDAEGEDERERGRRRDREREEQRPEHVGDARRAGARREAPKTTMTASRTATQRMLSLAKIALMT